MNYEKQIENLLVKSGGFVTTKDLKTYGIPFVYLHRMQNKGKIERFDRGIYVAEDAVYNEYYFFKHDIIGLSSNICLLFFFII